VGCDPSRIWRPGKRSAQGTSPGGEEARLFHRTFQTRTRAELLDGGSLYWSSGIVQVRQPLLDLTEAQDTARLLLLIWKTSWCSAPDAAPCVPGWRYLDPDEAPRTSVAVPRRIVACTEAPKQLAELGLL